MRALKVLTCFFLLLPAVSCRKGFVGINTNPSLISAGQVNYNNLFTNAQLQTSGNTDGNGYEDWRNNLIYSGCLIQHFASIQPYWNGDKYLYNPLYNSAYWDENYTNAIANITEVLKHTKTDTAQFNLYQITRIFRVFMFQRLTDMYGDCPYSEAGLGYISGITTPKYDRQQDIYSNMLQELQDAAGKLTDARPNTIGDADLLYSGRIAGWKKFAFSEMVRLAMRMSKVASDSARRWVNIAVSGGVMSDYTDNAVLLHQAVTGTPVANGSGLILIGNDPNGYRLSRTFINFLKSSGDPRLSYLATVCANPSVPSDKGDTTSKLQLGQPNGYDPPNSGTPYDLILAPGWSGNINSYSVVNRYTFSRLDAPSFFLTAGQTQLLLAEAAQRGWISTDAGTYFRTGVKAAMQQLTRQAGAGPSDEAITSWMDSNPYNGTLEQINTQYWVAGFMDENECFANWRRSGFPLLTPVNYPGNVTGGSIPRRFTYPQTEASVNAVNYQSAVSRLASGDKMTSRVWWDRP
ncbi:MAG: SusD/RagB family nutrient-binding outer membrane lipoprotein [Bacteroidetes bacterium]|nr:SusD/RagB family nutrient-binding outer membrane lipoprotein [Bacteroidota bacterium]